MPGRVVSVWRTLFDGFRLQFAKVSQSFLRFRVIGFKDVLGGS